MEIVNEKTTICRSMKILYSKDENYREDIEQRKNNGWKVARKPNWYDEKYDYAIKYVPNGTIITYIRYDKFE